MSLYELILPYLSSPIGNKDELVVGSTYCSNEDFDSNHFTNYGHLKKCDGKILYFENGIIVDWQSNCVRKLLPIKEFISTPEEDEDKISPQSHPQYFNPSFENMFVEIENDDEIHEGKLIWKIIPYMGFPNVGTFGDYWEITDNIGKYGYDNDYYRYKIQLKKVEQ